MNQREFITLYNRDRDRYVRFAKREFYKALRLQVEPSLEDFNARVSMQPMQSAYDKVYEYAGKDSAKKEYFRIKLQEGQKVDFVLQLLLATWSVWMREYVQANLGFLISQVTQNTQDAINRSLQDSLEAGDSREQTARRIYRYTLGEIGRRRALLIGRTETTRATNVGKRKSATDWAATSGDVVLYKKWIHIPQADARDFHIIEGRKPPIPMNADFEVFNPQTGGVNLMEQPGDPSAPAAQTCNCGCTTIYMSERYAKRNYEGTKYLTIKEESYSDYPDAAVNNSKRALKYVDANGWGTCGTPVGKARANQLANREPISRSTIARMASFKRHQQNANVPYGEGCGGLMWDCWGGTAGVEWAIRKLKEIDRTK